MNDDELAAVRGNYADNPMVSDLLAMLDAARAECERLNADTYVNRLCEAEREAGARDMQTRCKRLARAADTGLGMAADRTARRIANAIVALPLIDGGENG